MPAKRLTCGVLPSHKHGPNYCKLTKEQPSLALHTSFIDATQSKAKDFCLLLYAGLHDQVLVLVYQKCSSDAKS